MTKLKKAELGKWIVILLVIIAFIGRFIGRTILMGLIRSVIYIALMIAWGISVRLRVMQVQARRYMTAASMLSVLWMVLRTMKYFFIPVQSMARPVWYLYYLPILFIPLFALFAAMSLGRPENYRLPGRVLALYIPAALLLLLVLTNDFHQFVFTFPPGKPWTDHDYGYNFGFFIVIGWEFCMSVAAFVIMVKRCRIRTVKTAAPLIFVGASICYVILYYAGFRWLRVVAGDATVVQCCLFVLTFESCIRCGLIQTNTGYDDLFEACTFGVQITDREYHTRYASQLAPELSPEMMRRVETAPVMPDKNTLVKSSDIPGGHVLWKEDITELTAVIEELEDIGRELAERNYLERENYRTKYRISTLREKNRLMDLLQQRTERQIELLDRLLMQYENETDEENRRRLLAMTAVVCSYIKRCGNLLFISENTEVIDIAELIRCLEESLFNLELLGVSCGCGLTQKEMICAQDAIRAYSIFETVIEASMEQLVSVWLKGINTAEYFIIRLEVYCGADLSELSHIADGFTSEDGTYCFTVRLGKGGE